MIEKDTEMVPVPIPTEIPEPPKLDQIPLDILHSATVELLIQQNEDLSSRLKVNIRRNSQLEIKILEFEKKMKELERKKENLLAQVEIVKEKEKLWSEQKQERDLQLNSRQKESELLEVRYNELFTTSHQRQKENQRALASANEQIRDLERSLEIIKRVRSRAKEKLRAFLIDMAAGFHKSQKNIKKSESSQRMIRRNFEQLKTEVGEKENLFKEQLNTLKESSQKALQTVDLQLNETKEINERLQREKADLRQEISQLYLDINEEKKNRSKVSQLTEELNNLRNERVRFKREMQEAVAKVEESRSHEKQKNKESKEELKELRKLFEEQKQTLSACETQLLNINKENRELSEQLKAVQDLWVQAQDKLEKEELKSTSLARINKELSRQNQKDKLDRAQQRSQADLPATEALEKDDQKEFQNKIKDVFASQYRTFAKGPDLDL